MDKKWIGVLLVLVGAMMFLGNLGVFRGEIFLLILGAVFLGVYWFSRGSAGEKNIGFLIPGCILPMLALHTLIEENFDLRILDGYLFFILMGVAFLGVYLLHSINLTGGTRGSRNWPLYTSLALFSFTIFLFIVRSLEGDVGRTILSNLFPIALVITGIILFIKTNKGKGA